ncbi:MAG TPA: lysophospholipid acyltransferase family protein [Acidimicrobiia bacterium]|nr:lysophospholipid acyltransferase family protein [Acidimicrobiia bacterium]
MTWKRKERYWYHSGHLLSTAITYLLFRPKIIGRDNIPREGAVLIAPNHRSMLDIPCLGCATFRPLRFMAKKELFTNKFVKWYFETNGSFSVDKDASPQALKKALAVLRDDDALVIFPEGTRNKKSTLSELAGGAGFLAAKSSVPIVPVGIAGLDKLIKWKYCLPLPTRVKIVIGEPITSHVNQEGKTSEIVNALLPVLEERIQKLYEDALTL